jgi:hypothetical protein
LLHDLKTNSIKLRTLVKLGFILQINYFYRSPSLAHCVLGSHHYNNPFITRGQNLRLGYVKLYALQLTHSFSCLSWLTRECSPSLIILGYGYRTFKYIIVFLPRTS